jgi:hypothetical protein
MANGKQILDKLARDLEMLGMTVTRGASNSVIVDNASNDLTLSYTAASIQSPMGGVSDASAPYLGIGVANPGKIKIKSASTAADAFSDVIDSLIAAKVLAVVAGFANNIELENSDATYTAEIRSNADLIGLGQ